VGSTGIAGATRIGDRTAERVWRALPPLLVLVVVIAAWEAWGGDQVGNPLAAPSIIVEALGANTEVLIRSAWATVIEALGGLFIGTAAGLLMAFAAARFIVARDVLLPLAIGAAAVPLIAMAPIFNNWFGLTNPLSKMAMAALLVFFPVFISVTRGLVEVSPAALELMRSYAVSDTEVLRKVRIPNMMPFFFTALKVGTTLAFIGAIVAEYFGGTSEVLGRVIINAMFAGKYGLAWSGIFLGAFVAIGAYMVVAALERRVIPWYIALRGGEA